MLAVRFSKLLRVDSGGGAVLVLALVLGCVACLRTHPDEGSFADTVADLVVNDELIESGKTVVLNAKDFSQVPHQVREAVVRRLEKSSIPWNQLELGDGWQDFPGTWKEGRFHRANETHVLLDLRIDNGGHERTVRWGHVCGPACGTGAEVVLGWTGDRWSTQATSTIRY